MKKVRVVIYWLSILPPVFDMIKGAILGVQRGLDDIKKRDAALKEAINIRKFDDAND